MARRFPKILLIVLLYCLALPLNSNIAQGKQLHDLAALCGNAGSSNAFQSASATTQVLVCPPVVETGRAVLFAIHARPNTQVRVVIQYPNGDTALKIDRTDAAGIVAISLIVRYNPPYRYVSVPFQVIVGRPNAAESDVVAGTITVGQLPTIGVSKLRIHQVGIQTWCPADPLACIVHNGSSIIIRVDTQPRDPVSVSLFYPDGSSVPCAINDLTGTTISGDDGVYRCTLPVTYQPKQARARVNILVLAQISIGGNTVSLQRKFWLVFS